MPGLDLRHSFPPRLAVSQDVLVGQGARLAGTWHDSVPNTLGIEPKIFFCEPKARNYDGNGGDHRYDDGACSERLFKRKASLRVGSITHS